jgi:hypothetical protein
VEMALWYLEGGKFSQLNILLSSKGRKEWDNNNQFFWFYFFSIPSIVWAHVKVWKFSGTKNIWFGLFVWKWHYDKWKGVKFPKTLSLLNSKGREKWKNKYHYFWFFFQFHQLYELSWKKKHLIWTFCVEMALWQVEGVKFSQNIITT